MRKIKTDKMRKRRRHLDLTQKELANELKITTVYLNQIERGKMIPSKKLISRIENILGMRSGSLLVRPRIKTTWSNRSHVSNNRASNE